MLKKIKDILNTYTEEELKDITLWINDTSELKYILFNDDSISLITNGTEIKVNGYIEQEGKNER